MLVNYELLYSLGVIWMYFSVVIISFGIAEDIVREYQDNQERAKYDNKA